MKRTNILSTLCIQNNSNSVMYLFLMLCLKRNRRKISIMKVVRDLVIREDKRIETNISAFQLNVHATYHNVYGSNKILYLSDVHEK